MKKITIIILAILFAFQNLYSQDYYKKFKNSYSYIDSVFNKDNHWWFNVCPVIRYISIKNINGIDKGDSILIDSNMYEENSYFLPFIEPSFDSVFKNKKEYNHYVYFSKPTKNTLLAEFCEGEYSVQNFDIPLFGISTVFLFIFDENENIVKIYKQGLINN